MDPVEKVELDRSGEITIGELVSYYYQKYSEIYDNPELRDLAVATVVGDLLARAQELE